MAIDRSDRSSLEVRVLGPLEVVIDGEPLVVDTRKALAILALLAVEGRPFAREELAGLLWPEADDESARGALRRTLSVLRSALHDRWLVVDRATVRLDAGVHIDLNAFEGGLASDDATVLRAAAELARGPFLAGFGLRDSPGFDDWRAARASAVERDVGEVLVRLGDVLLERRDPVGAAAVFDRRISLDPLDEGAHRRLIGALAAGGDRTGAIRAYRTCVAVLERELGVSPLPETTALYEAIREGRAPDDAPVPALGAAEHAPRLARLARPPLVGRDLELDRALAVWRGIRTDGRVVVVEGEPGIGKTRLLDAIGDRIGEAGARVLVARGYPGEASIPYGPVVDLLRAELAGGGRPAWLDTLPTLARRELARLVDLPGLPDAAGTSRGGPGVRARLLDALATALDRMAAGSVPGALVVDDAHWLDATTRETLLYLVRRLAGRPMVVVVSWRREDLDAASAAFADALTGSASAIVGPLPRLDSGASAALLRALSPVPLGDESIDAYVAECEGLPLHLVERATGSEASDASGGMAALVRDRLRQATGIAEQVLGAAAVIGRSFDLATVRAASGRTEEEAIDALDALARQGIVREIGAGPGGSVRYDFAHGRLSEGAYAATSLARRRLLHGRVAGALREQPGARDDVAVLARIARHLLAAGQEHEAAHAYREAGERAALVYANAEAIEHLDAALALTTSGAAGIRVRIGELRMRLGDYPGAVAALEAAAAEAWGTELAAVERLLAAVHLRRGDAGAADSHLAAALEATPDGDARGRAVLLAERAVVAVRAGHGSHAARWAAEAAERADEAGDPPTRTLVLRVQGLVARSQGDLSGAAGALEESLAEGLRAGDVAPIVASRNALALVLAALGDTGAAIVHAEAALADARMVGDRHLEAVVENTIADALHAAGRRDASIEHLKRAVALFAEVGGRPDEPEPGIWLLETW